MIGRNFTYELARKIDSTPGNDGDSISWVGAVLFGVPGVRSKEGGDWFRPHTRSGKPSVMMEFGYLEGMDFLRLDAEWWLVNSSCKPVL